jgi:redox-sensitive bicupin YhaK (pirin superfamily)
MTSDFRQSRIVKLIQNGNASFSAFRANRNNYDGLFSPVMGFDDFRLDKDVFGPHQHRHMSALSYLFDDSAPYHNRDSMGSDLTIPTGSLLWTWAGSGVTHHEFPENEGEKIHGLQLFLEIPVETRNQPPKGLLIPVEEMPVMVADGIRVKVVLGAAAGMVNYIKTPEDITFLDVQMHAGKSFRHTLPKQWNATVYVLAGALVLDTPTGKSMLGANDTVALGASDTDASIIFHAETNSHILFISGLPVA